MILEPFLALLRSRKLMAAIVALIVDFIIVSVPQLEGVQVELVVVVSALAGLLISLIAYEDGHLAFDAVPSDVTPVFGPLGLLLRSRKFVAAVLALALDVVIAVVPQLEGVRVELMTIATALAGLLMGATAYENVNAERIY